jgi:hypothetical protein
MLKKRKVSGHRFSHTTKTAAAARSLCSRNEKYQGTASAVPQKLQQQPGHHAQGTKSIRAPLQPRPKNRRSSLNHHAQGTKKYQGTASAVPQKLQRQPGH